MYFLFFIFIVRRSSCFGSSAGTARGHHQNQIHPNRLRTQGAHFYLPGVLITKKVFIFLRYPFNTFSCFIFVMISIYLVPYWGSALRYKIYVGFALFLCVLCAVVLGGVLQRLLVEFSFNKYNLALYC